MVAPRSPVQLLEDAGRGEALTDAEWGALTSAWLDGAATDAQMSAMLARAGLSGLGVGAQAEVVEEILARGERLDLAPLGPSATVVTGAVADPLELIVPPVTAALGIATCVVAGRGRGRVLGTLDKLEAIFGIRTSMSSTEVARQLSDVGLAVVGPGRRFATGLSQLEALMEQTGLGLAAPVAGPGIAARLLVSGAQTGAVALAAGSGGLLESEAGARPVTMLLDALAADWGRTVHVIEEDASVPLGPAIGASLEFAAAGGVISGGGDPRLRERAVAYAGALAEAAGVVEAGAGAVSAEMALDDGRALAAAERWVEAQGADPTALTDPGRLPEAPHRREVVASADGVLARVDAGRLGEVARWVGAGRLHASQSVDPVAGVEILVRRGQRVDAGEPVAVVHSGDGWQAGEGVSMLESAFVIDAGGDG